MPINMKGAKPGGLPALFADRQAVGRAETYLTTDKYLCPGFQAGVR